MSNKTDLEKLSREELVDLVIKLQAGDKGPEKNNKRKFDQLENSPEKPNKKQKTQRAIDWSKYSKRHIALKVAYIGWNYHGLAAQQETEETVEGHLIKALLRTHMVEDIKTANFNRSGRTDKGVSAFGQVISLHMRSKIKEGLGVVQAGTNMKDSAEEIDYISALNGVLPGDIRVIGWAPVPLHFNARFSTLSRTYRYFFFKSNLDIQKMKEASRGYLGPHDFRNFCRMDVVHVANFERNILSIEITPVEDGNDVNDPHKLYYFTITGFAFLWHQIRCMVAILFLIGAGHESPSIIKEMLDVKAHPNKPVYEMASEIPLILYDCSYEDVTFIQQPEEMKKIYDHLIREWQEKEMKSAVARALLNGLEASYVHNVPKTSATDADIVTLKAWAGTNAPQLLVVNSFVGATTKSFKNSVYTPLWKRPAEASLEERLEGAGDKKRQKIDKSNQNNPRLKKQRDDQKKTNGNNNNNNNIE